MNLKKINTGATIAVTTILMTLAIGAFSLSFNVLKKEAEKHGVDPSMTWVFAASMDLSIFGSSLFVIWASINKKVGLVRLGYGTIAVVTLLSVYLNMSHAKAFEVLPILYMITPPILLATMTFLVERMLEVVLSGVDATDVLHVRLQKLQGKITELESTLQDTTTKYEARLLEEQGKLQLQTVRLQQLQSNYDQVAETVKLLPYIRSEVFLLAKVAANMMSLDEAYKQQEIYNHKTGFINFANKVMISGDENV